MDWLDSIMIFITSLGNAGWFWLVLMAVMLLFAKYRKIGLTGLLAILIGVIITNLWLKNMVDRIPPFHPDIPPALWRQRWYCFVSCRRNLEYRRL